jgi:hypothetical protein
MKLDLNPAVNPFHVEDQEATGSTCVIAYMPRLPEAIN